MQIVGLTGGIGSGKSLVGKIFETLGAPVFEADRAGRDVLETKDDVKKSVIRLLGETAYSGEKADRKYIASVVFADPEKLQKLNEIIHPAVAKEFERWQATLPQNSGYCIRESAILFESNSNQDCDKVICVSAPEEIRISRVMKRDNVTKESVLDRISKQMNEAEKIKKSDFVLFNDGSLALIPQVVQIHETLLNQKNE